MLANKPPGKVRYAVAIAASAAALLVTKLLEPSLEGTVLPPTFAAVVLSSLYGGLGAGLFATAVGALGLKYLFLPEVGSFVGFSSSSVVRLLLFVALALPLSVVSASLRRAIDGLRKAVRSREDVLAIVSHDLRTPLGSILMSAASLRKQLPPHENDRMQAGLQRIERSAESMERLIRDLLDFASMEGGKLEMRLAEDTMSEVLDDAWAPLDAAAHERRIQLTREIEASPAPTLCDRERITQVVWNLVGNALKYTPEGGRVHVSVKPAGKYVRVAVRDTGPGIASHDLGRIFDRYWRARTSPGVRGTGLGLAIAKTIVESHGGRISVESRVGEGSTFAFTIPYAPAAARPELRLTRAALTAAPGPPAKGWRA
jgi:signal transduction histidine kinase